MIEQLWNDWGTIYLWGFGITFLVFTILTSIGFIRHQMVVDKYSRLLVSQKHKIPEFEYKPWKQLLCAALWPITIPLIVCIFVIFMTVGIIMIVAGWGEPK